MHVPVTTDIARAASIIREGRVAAFPTGTSYGLAADVLQGYALQRLRNLKGRPPEKTFTVFMRTELWKKFLAVTAAERKLLQRMHNKPLTLLVRPQEGLTHLAQEEYIGLRVIDHPLMEQLAETLDVPLTATSANKTGQQPCSTPACVQQTFPWQQGESTYDLSLGCILDGGELPNRKPTTIARLNGNNVIIVRQGALNKQMLEAALRK